MWVCLRRSRFNSADRGRYIVTRVDYRLTFGGAPTLRYADLQRAFADGEQPSLVEVAAQVRRVRQSKGMLIVEGDPDCRSAGSFFKNPVVDEEQLRQIAAASDHAPPRFLLGRAQKIWGGSRFRQRGLSSKPALPKGTGWALPRSPRGIRWRSSTWASVMGAGEPAPRKYWRLPAKLPRLSRGALAFSWRWSR